MCTPESSCTITPFFSSFFICFVSRIFFISCITDKPDFGDARECGTFADRDRAHNKVSKTAHSLA